MIDKHKILTLAFIFFISGTTTGFTYDTNSEEIFLPSFEQLDSLIDEKSNELNKFDTSTEIMEHAQKTVQIKDGDITALSNIMGLFMQAEALKEFCATSGHIPTKYINAVKSYNKNNKLDMDIINEFIKEGSSREEANILLTKLKEMSLKTHKIVLEKDFVEMQNGEASSKADYCILYDIYADDFISDKLDKIKATIPETYKKYFPQ